MIAFAVHGAHGAPSAGAFDCVLGIQMAADAPSGDVVVGHRHIVESVVDAG